MITVCDTVYIMFVCVYSVFFSVCFIFFLSEFQVESPDATAHLSARQLHRFCISWLPLQTGFID